MRGWRRFFRQKQNWIGLFLVGLVVVVAVAAPWLAPPEDPAAPSPYKLVGRLFDRVPHPPSDLNPLGTTLRRSDVGLSTTPPGLAAAPQLDVYHTLIWGTRSALRFGLTVTIVTAIFGLLVGLISGYAGGFVNDMAMHVTDSFLAFPTIAGVVLFQRVFFSPAILGRFVPDPGAIQALVENLGLSPVMLALIVFSWMPYARLVNTMVNQLKSTEFVVAARSLGAAAPRVVFRHLLPNSLAPVIVLMARDVGAVVILESTFTFIGLQGDVAWGVLLVGGRDYIIGLGGNPFAYWWTFVPVAVALIIFGVGWNLLGDGLNTALNPRAARR
jgi:peptide/nickel transport system permease protein